MKSTTLKLPKPHLSWSQIDLWRRSKKQYAERYFYGKDGFTNNAMRYGKKFAEALETGETDGDEILELATKAVPQYAVSEYRLEATLETEAGNIKILGFLDTSEDPPSEGIREYKTGVTPWTQKKVDKHGQLTLYATMVYLNEKKLPKKMHLDWIQTQNDSGVVSLTGNIESFETTRTVGDVLEMVTIIKRTAAEISRAYTEVIKSIL